MYVETSPCSFDSSLFKSWPPRAGLGHNKGSIFYIFIKCRSLLSDVTPGPLISWSFEVEKLLEAVERVLVSNIKCLKNQFCAEKNVY